MSIGVVEHYCKARGAVPSFGAITGYFLVTTVDYAGMDFGFPYDVNGRGRAGPMCEVRRLSEAVLTTSRGRPLVGTLENTPIEVIPIDRMGGRL
jgi:hypothetical protein